MEQPLGERLALLTDLYQLTMAACYFDQGMADEATFSLFIRKYPADRGYFVAAGLAEALEYLETLQVQRQTTWPILPAPASFRRLSSITSSRCASPARCTPCPKAASFSKTSPSWR